jgi:hypothetical protein
MASPYFVFVLHNKFSKQVKPGVRGNAFIVAQASCLLDLQTGSLRYELLRGVITKIRLRPSHLLCSSGLKRITSYPDEAAEIRQGIGQAFRLGIRCA